MYKIFIVEDDPVISAALAEHMGSWGWETRRCADFSNVLGEYAAFGPHLTLLDISLPFFNGYHWCSEIRRVSKAPVMFISSASEDMNIVMAMNMGGDDFIAKPFELNVLTAKIQALLRRSYDFGAASSLMECGGAVLNRSDGSFVFNGGRIELTRNEYRIILSLFERRGAVVTREELMLALWETDAFVDDNTLTVNMTRLRRKLEGAGLAGFIRTRKGVGYIIGE